VVVEAGALERLPELMAELGLPGTVWILADANTFAAAGGRVEEVLRRAGRTVSAAILEPGPHGHLAADEENLDRACAAFNPDAGLVLGVGAGVINDLGKLVAGRYRAAYVAVPTAASMNGYGSPIAALVEGGVKVTRPTVPTEAIVADATVLAAAPARLTRSGFGDLLAKNSANADWFIAARLTGAYYCDVPVELVRRASDRVLGQAEAVGRGEPPAVAALTRGLVAGAFAMAAAGESAPASGGEHLISHYLDMTAHAFHRTPALHGEQVALGTLIAAALYERIVRLDIDTLRVQALVDRYPDWPQREAEVRRVHGRLAEHVLGPARAQHLTKAAYRARLERIRAQWGGIWSALAGRLLDCRTIRAAYERAGTPTRAADLDIDPNLLATAIRFSRDIRDRYTILHLAADLGVLDDWTDEILDASGVC